MYIVYVLKSLKDPRRCYIGLTENLKERVDGHNSSDSYYTKRYAPWELESYIGFKKKHLAAKFERYLKHGSGFAFLKRHLLEPLD